MNFRLRLEIIIISEEEELPDAQLILKVFNFYVDLCNILQSLLFKVK